MNKEEYFAKMHAQLTVWQQKLDNLESSMQGAKESVKDVYKKDIQDLKGKIQNAEEKLDAAKESSAGAWDELKSSIQSSFDELKSGFDAAWQRIRE